MEMENAYQPKAAPQKEHIWRKFFRLLKRVKIPWLLVIIAVALSLVTARLSVYFPDYQRRFFDGDIATPTVMRGIGILAVTALLGLINTYFGGYLRNRIARDFRDTVWRKSLDLKISELDGMNPKELISRTTNDTRMIGDFLVTVTSTLITTVYAVTISMQTIAGYHRKLALYQLLILPIFFVVKGIQGKISFSLQYKIQLRITALTEFLAELLANVPLIKTFVKEKDETARGNALIDESNRIQMKSEMIGLVFTAIDYILENGNRVFAILYGAHLIRIGELDIGTWISYFYLVSLIYQDFNSIVTQWPLIKGIQGAVERVAEILEMPEEDITVGSDIQDPEAPIRAEDLEVVLGTKTILRDINLELPRNRKIAIVGASGAGKTTFLNTLERFYEPASGRLVWGQQDIADTRLDKYRTRFAYVPQQVLLFHGTLKENLCYGLAEEPTPDDLANALKAASLSTYVAELPDGLDTVIDEGGTNLSGGERQRLAIARAFLQNADIVLLDEATANLDAEAEYHVLQAIDALCVDRTLIMVAHRLRLVKDADVIFLLDQGRLINQGTHAELMQNEPMYRELYELEQVTA